MVLITFKVNNCRGSFLILNGFQLAEEQLIPSPSINTEQLHLTIRELNIMHSHVKRLTCKIIYYFLSLNVVESDCEPFVDAIPHLCTYLNVPYDDKLEKALNDTSHQDAYLLLGLLSYI